MKKMSGSKKIDKYRKMYDACLIDGYTLGELCYQELGLKKSHKMNIEFAKIIGTPSNIAYLIDEDNFKFKKQVYEFSIIDKILHFFGKHIYVWDKKGCIYPGCNEKN